MKFENRFKVNASLDRVGAFHSRSASMPAITPPPMIVRVNAAPETLGNGDEMDFTLWAGPLPLRWVARIENAGKNGFTDRQVRGPFETWTHRHNFRKVDARTTEVYDHVEARVKRHVFWGPVGWLMWAGMPLLFRFRAARTRRLLEAGN